MTPWAALFALLLAAAAPAVGQSSEAEVSAEGMTEAIMLACLPAVSGILDLSDESAIIEAMGGSGFTRMSEPDQLTALLAPPDSRSISFERPIDAGKLAVAVAQDRPFCTIAASELDDPSLYFDAAYDHFENDATPFVFQGERMLPRVPMVSSDFRWDLNERQSIGANLMRTTVDLPQGQGFIILTMFLSTESES